MNTSQNNPRISNNSDRGNTLPTNLGKRLAIFLKVVSFRTVRKIAELQGMENLQVNGVFGDDLNPDGREQSGVRKAGLGTVDSKLASHERQIICRQPLIQNH
jgi:hypothetical protein